MISAVIIVAAGSSTRMGKGRKKEYLNLDNKPVLHHVYEAFSQTHRFRFMYVMVPPGGIPEVRKIMKPVLAVQNEGMQTEFVEGGATRQQSVLYGLQALEPTAPDYVLIHDGARPWIRKDDILAVLENTVTYGACAPAVIPPDAIKQVGKDGFIAEHMSRKTTVGIQTPQGFRYGEILEAHKKASADNETYIDDTEVYCRYVHPVFTCPGNVLNKKITYSHDLDGCQ